MMEKEQCTVAVALCGSFCTFDLVLPQIQRLIQQGYRVIPVMSFYAAGMDTRFGTAESWKQKLYEITGFRPIETLQDAEPLGPKQMAEAMIVAPCTGTTLAKLALGISDTPVTLGVKSMLRNQHPIVIAPSTNDGLGASAGHIATLMGRKNFYLVPFAQDDYLRKPQSLKSDFTLLPDTLAAALRGKQLQPVLFP